VTIDVGTGDGKAVLATAAAEPTTLAIGIDADAASMAELSRRAARSPLKGGLPNALFVLAAAEALPVELCGLAELVTVQFPWGSLLRGCLGAEPRVAEALAALVAPGGTLGLLLAPAERDRLAGLPTEPAAVVAAVGRAFADSGLCVIEGRPATAEELVASHSTWARRLLSNGSAGRTAIRVPLRS
jgi:16S rRNA (adenine(1408)-N(1))-methyltransferase